MSERKRGFDDSAGSSQQGSAKKAATRALADPSGDTSLSLVQPSGVEDGRSNAEQLQSQSQAAAGQAQEEERAVAPQGRGRGVERRAQNLISATDLRGASSVNRQAGGIDGAGGGKAPELQSQGDGKLARSREAISITGPGSGPAPPVAAPPPARPPLPKQSRPRFVSGGGDPTSLLTPELLERALAAAAAAASPIPLPRTNASDSKIPVIGSAEALRVQSQLSCMIGQPHGSQPAVAPPRPPSRTVELIDNINNVLPAAPAEQALAPSSSGMVLAAGDLQLAPPLPQPEQCPYCHVRTGTMMDQPTSHCCLCKECLTRNGNALCPVCSVRGRIG